jgi:hypothetical protein
MRELKTTVTLRYYEVEQTTSTVSMALSIRNYDNGKTNNLKTVTLFYYIISRQRDMGEFVTVYTSEIRKYDYINAKVNFARQNVMMKDFCRNEDDTMLRFELFEYTK